MKNTTLFSEEKKFFPTRFARIFAGLILFCSFGVLNLTAQSTKEFKTSTDTLVVYSDVPGLPPSDKYTIRVRSAATNNKWVDVFTHYTYNRAAEYPDIPDSDGKNSATVIMAYSVFTKGWSHSYGNIEMNNNQAVEVEIAAKDTSKFKIGGQNFFKATVHPTQKASIATVVDGKVYFTITKPAQIVIDINGQMDDYDAAVNPIGAPVHAISLWANPVINKPSLNNPRVRFIEPGTSLATINGISPLDYDTMYFKAGVHNVGRCVDLHPDKTYYLPGDALLYGVLSNELTAKPSKNITVYGYGTIAGDKITHYKYSYYYPNEGGTGSSHPITIEGGVNYRVHGICIVDPAAHSKSTDGTGGYNGWLKAITWRQNGDGFGGWDYHEDCFLRTHDDASYAKGTKKRCTFWKDAHAAFFHMAVIPENGTNPLIIEDCDILYARLRSQGDANLGGVFEQRGGGVAGQRNVNVLFRNIRIHDTKLGTSVFNLVSDAGSSYKGIVWQNISMPVSTVKSRMYGTAASPWYGGITYDNVTIGGVLLTQQNFLTYFNTNEFVKDVVFKAPGDNDISHNIAVSANAGGTVSGGGTFILKTYATVTAVPAANFGFVNWTENGVPVSNDKSFNFLVTQNRTLVANFVEISTLTNIIAPTGWVAGTTNNKIDGSNRMMVVMVSGENTATKFSATGITYGGQPMTNRIDTCYASDATSARTYTSIFTLNEAGVNAATSGDIAVTWSVTPSAGTDVQSVLLCNVDQTTPVYAIARAATLGKTLSTTAMSVTMGDIIIMSGANYNSLAITFNNGFTKRLESNSAWGDAVSGEKVVIGATETPSFTQSFSGRIVLCAIAVKQIPAASSVNRVSKFECILYPNPATDKFFFNSADKLISKIELVDLAGKILYSAKVQRHNGSVDLTGIAKGMYLVKIHAENTIVSNKISVR